MPRVVSFIVLLAIILLLGSMFFEVILQFVVPLFLAAVLVVIFKPLHEWVLWRITVRPRLAAGVTTALIVLVVLIPMIWLGWNAYREADVVFDFVDDEQQQEELITRIDNGLQHLREKYKEKYKELTGKRLDVDVKSLAEKGSQIVGSILLASVQAVFGFLVGGVIMMLAVYYFFADGPAMVKTLMRLSPLDDQYEAALLDKFAAVSRSVVLATGLSAVVQGILAGIGYYFACPAAAPIFLLIAATMLFAIVPFVGSTAIWLPTCLLLYFYAGHTTAAIVLAIYCATIVSMADNLIKPLVLHGQTNLHPLLALLSILGGVQVLGPIGIIVGPMLVAFLQALLVMLNRELQLLGNEATDDGAVAALVGGPPPVPLPAAEPSGQKRGKRKRKK